MKSFCKELRDAAMNCPDILIRNMAKDIADEIAGNIIKLGECASKENMQALNASWVRGVNILAKTHPTPDTPPRSGAGEAPRRVIEQERLAA